MSVYLSNKIEKLSPNFVDLVFNTFPSIRFVLCNIDSLQRYRYSVVLVYSSVSRYWEESR
jgi:hypothetical protein